MSVRLSRIEKLLLKSSTPTNSTRDIPVAVAADNDTEHETSNPTSPDSISVIQAEVHRNLESDRMSVASTEEFLPNIQDETQDLNSQPLTIQLM